MGTVDGGIEKEVKFDVSGMEVVESEVTGSEKVNDNSLIILVKDLETDGAGDLLAGAAVIKTPSEGT